MVSPALEKVSLRGYPLCPQSAPSIDLASSSSGQAAAMLPLSATGPVASAIQNPKKRRGRPPKVLSHSMTASSNLDVTGNSRLTAESDAVDGSKAVAPCALSKKKSSKRKRALISEGPLDSHAKAALVEQFQSEVFSLVKFYHEDSNIRLECNDTSGRFQIAFMIQESSLPFSRLVDEVLQQLNNSGGAESNQVTLASLRATILSIGERISFGMPNPNADVLEDTSESCLWCWEVRDLKKLPENQRTSIAVRRRKRKKISERLSALSDMISALSISLDDVEKEQSFIMKAEVALRRTDDEDMIRVGLGHLQQKKAAKEVHKEVKSKEKEALKEQHKLDREREKERRRLDKEGEKKRLQLEKEKERLEKEAQKEALRQEKELRRHQEEAEREVKKKEKDATDYKKQAALQKQVTLMDRFLQSKKDRENLALSEENSSASGNQASQCEPASKNIVYEIDQVMLNSCNLDLEVLYSCHAAAWKKLKMGKIKRWGQRRSPKLPGINELRLQGGAPDGTPQCCGSNVHPKSSVRQASEEDHELEDAEVKFDKLESGWDSSGCMPFLDPVTPQDSRSETLVKILPLQYKRKLLQFDKSHRPAYYGTFSKQSNVVRPRNPLQMDPNLDYDIDSDEEWEEEDPGESLSDCDKDEEDEKVDVEEDDDNADGFVVPDGYLSESEVAQVDEEAAESESDTEVVGQDSSLNASEADALKVPQNVQSLLLPHGRQRKLLAQFTDQALKSNRPLIINSFQQDKTLSSASRKERICLEALRICPLSCHQVFIEVPQPVVPTFVAGQATCQVQDTKDKINDQAFQSQKTKPKKALLPDSALPEVVEALISCPRGGLKKTVDALSLKFPLASRAQLREKVKQISDYQDNHWQVKKEVLYNLGITPPLQQQATNIDTTVSNAKVGAAQPKTITKFFSKRCLPPEKAGYSIASSPPTKKPNLHSNLEKENSSPHVQPAWEEHMHSKR